MLPDCKYRGNELYPGQFECSCPHLIHFRGYVTEKTCNECFIPKGEGVDPATLKKATDTTSCTLRGEQLRLEDCKSCEGNVRVKVFACPLFSECTIRPVEEVEHACTTCLERQPDS